MRYDMLRQILRNEDPWQMHNIYNLVHGRIHFGQMVHNPVL